MNIAYESYRPRGAGSLKDWEQPKRLPDMRALVQPQTMGLTVMSASKAPFLCFQERLKDAV